jgi:hypothetical protein
MEILFFPDATFLVVQRIQLPLELKTSTAIRLAPSGTVTSATRFGSRMEIVVSCHAGPGEARSEDGQIKIAIKTATAGTKTGRYAAEQWLGVGDETGIRFFMVAMLRRGRRGNLSIGDDSLKFH